MKKFKWFLGLKWKFTLGLGIILMSLYGFYAYYVYYEAIDDFASSREVSQNNKINIARALTLDSFNNLERFVESIVILSEMQTEQKTTDFVDFFNKNWGKWQFNWDLKNVIFYNSEGNIIHKWGDNNLQVTPYLVKSIINQEVPSKKIVCDVECFQQVIIPVLSAGQIRGISITSSLLETLINYRDALQSDIGVLMTADESSLSAVTNANQNNSLWKRARQKHDLSYFMQSLAVFQDENETFAEHKDYEIHVFAIDKQIKEAPYYVVINDITEKKHALNNKLYTLGFIGLGGLLLVIFSLLLSVHFALARVTILYKALPLLVEHQYQAFRDQITIKRSLRFTDEVDLLTQTATEVAQELEILALEVDKNTYLLLNKHNELEKERDFVNQLIYTAPIIILTQDLHGKVLSINHTGIKSTGFISTEVVGNNFMEFIPKNETEHLLSIENMVVNETYNINVAGILRSKDGENLHIDWTHTLINNTQSDQEPVILSLGMNITEQYLANQKLVWMATHDQLTGLSNRRNFQTELEKILVTAKPTNTKVALFYLDLDQFKIINDTHGHLEGDQLLKLISNVLKEEVREQDLLSRIGGDEFTLVIPNTNIKEIKQVAQKIIHSLKQVDYSINDKPHIISFSIGISIYPEHAELQQELLANADLAMYHAKKTGRSKYHIFKPGFDYQELLSQQIYWKNIINQAIEKDEFILFFQPILDIKYHKISHYECLIRIEQLDTKKLLMPGDFIHIAEQIGIIDQIDRIVLQKAIEQHLSFQKQGNNARLAINLSGRSMNNMEILNYIEPLLNQAGVKPDLIIFEITETSAVSNFEAAKELIKKLRALGCRFALDDFGVGFSSFYYLKSLPVDYVKIDGSFVKQMDVNTEDQIFVKVLTEVSQAFGKKIIAEFVENEQILELLGQLGVDYAQGYYVSKPLRDPLDLKHVKGLATLH